MFDAVCAWLVKLRKRVTAARTANQRVLACWLRGHQFGTPQLADGRMFLCCSHCQHRTIGWWWEIKRLECSRPASWPSSANWLLGTNRSTGSGLNAHE